MNFRASVFFGIRSEARGLRWISTNKALPEREALLWSGGRYRIGVLVRETGIDPAPAFMDASSDELLAWPSHWFELPPPPKQM